MIYCSLQFWMNKYIIIRKQNSFCSSYLISTINRTKAIKILYPLIKYIWKYPWLIKLDSGQLLVHKPKTTAEHVVFTEKIKKHWKHLHVAKLLLCQVILPLVEGRISRYVMYNCLNIQLFKYPIVKISTQKNYVKLFKFTTIQIFHIFFKGHFN